MSKELNPSPVVAAELSCRPLKSLLVYFRREYGEGRLDDTIRNAGLGAGIDRSFLEDENNWVGFAQAQRVLDALSDASRDSMFPRRAGLHMATREVLGTGYGLLRAFGTPRLCYRKTIEISRLYNRVGGFTIVRLTGSRMELEYRSAIREPNRRFCEYRLGQFESFPTIWGAPPARGRELTCQATGADACRYEFEWLNQPSFAKPALYAGLAAAAGALAAHADVAIAGPAVTVCASLVGALLGVVLEYRSRLRDRDQQLTEESDDVLRSLQSLTARFEEIQELNRTLEFKVDARTRELKDTAGQLEKALSRALEVDQLKTQFFNNLNHDLRSPLTVITGALTNLAIAPDIGENTARRQLVDLALRSSTRLEAMINDLLELGRIDGGVRNLDLARVDLVDVVKEVVEVTQPFAAGHRLTLTAELPAEPIEIDVDVDKIERVLVNLLTNACKFTPEGKRVHVSVADADDKVAITVADEGIGIPREERSRVFERFVRGSAPEHRAVKGVGIGLAVVRDFVGLHGGVVTLDSEVGRGSAFTVYLPKVQARPGRRGRIRGRARHLAMVLPDVPPPAARPKGIEPVPTPPPIAISPIAISPSPATATATGDERDCVAGAD